MIGFENVFHSLYAPVIRLGQRPEEPDRFMEERDPRIFRMPVMNRYEYNRHYIDDDMVTESGTVPYTIISRGDIKVIEDIILQGDIHSDGAVRIMENASVLGNIFAENDILLEKMQQCLETFLHRATLYLKKVPVQVSRIRLFQLLPAEQ